MINKSVQTANNNMEKAEGQSMCDKIILQKEDYSDINKKAATCLVKLEELINKEDAEDTLIDMYTEINEIKRKIYCAPNYLDGLLWIIGQFIDNAKKEYNSLYVKFKTIKFFEDIYHHYEVIFSEDYNKLLHDKYFREGLEFAYDILDEEIREILKEIYSDYFY